MSDKSKEAVLAYLLDRREQYEVNCGSYHAITELIEGIAEGEHIEAHTHGEFDDMLADRTVWPWNIKKERA